MTLLELAERCEAAEGPSRELDTLIWAAVGSTKGGDAAKAWRDNQPLGPNEIVNGMTLHEAIARYPTDVRDELSIHAIMDFLARADATWSGLHLG